LTVSRGFADTLAVMKSQHTERAARTLLETFVSGFDTQKSAAEALGISSSYLNDILKGNRPIPSHVLDRIGLERVVSFRVKAKAS
jgi:plasmid maintenance system antidote protein VapI